MSQSSPHMNSPSDAHDFLLEYALKHGIAEDALAIPVGACINRDPTGKESDEIGSYLEGDPECLAFDGQFVNDFESQKLSVSTEEGRLLCNIMQDKEVETDWNAVIPPLRHGCVPNVEYPLLTEDREIRNSVKSQGPLDSDMVDVRDETAAVHEEDTTESLQELADSARASIVEERLDCGRESIAFDADLQRDSVLFPEETQLRFDSVTGKHNGPVRHSNDTLQRSDLNEERKSPSSVQLVPSPGLGNLSSFLSTRGVMIPALPNSPHFAKEEPPKKPQEDESPQAASTSPEIILNITAPPVTPSQDIASEEIVCFLSTELLKSRLSHVRHLDSKHNSQLIYRDYDPKSPEADIIVSPKTGIILTSAHMLTQKYLPGHKASREDIVSPITERIYLTAPRYERVYIFICVHSSKADEQIQDAITSLESFCASLSEETSIIPLIVSETDGAVTDWVMYLGHAELSSMVPAIRLQDSETRWEIILRGYGLNPFAARLVLDMGVELGTFIEMGSKERQCQFGNLLGERVLRRVGAAIEKREGVKEY